MKGLNNLSICLLISFIGVSVCVTKPICTSDFEELWPHEDPNHFWYCHHAGSTPIDLPCPLGRGFLRNDDRHGCIPYTEWKCRANVREPSCSTLAEYEKPHRHVIPNKFYGCPEPMGTKAKELTCEPGLLFVDNVENLGCVPPSLWTCDKTGGDRE